MWAEILCGKTNKYVVPPPQTNLPPLSPPLAGLPGDLSPLKKFRILWTKVLSPCQILANKILAKGKILWGWETGDPKCGTYAHKWVLSCFRVLRVPPSCVRVKCDISTGGTELIYLGWGYPPKLGKKIPKFVNISSDTLWWKKILQFSGKIFRNLKKIYQNRNNLRTKQLDVFRKRHLVDNYQHFLQKM